MMARSKSVQDATRLHLLSLLPKLRTQRVLLVGDLVADHYIFGNTSRISREAPVLILKYQQESIIPGQAGNTAANIAALGAIVAPLGVIGKDARGKELKAALRSRRVNTAEILELPGLATLTKTRILAGGHHAARQQVIRIDDDERLNFVTSVVEPQIIAAMRRLAASADVIVVSDYGYGIVSDAVWNAAVTMKSRHKIPLVLDSRYKLTSRKGATLITPNEGEAVACCRLSVDDDYRIGDVGRKLLKLTGAENVLITRGNEGMVLFPRGSKPVVIPIHGSDECTDVTGAGDTVVATIAVALAAGATPEAAARLANIAGGIVVMKIGTATVTVAELTYALSAN
ncbi:MAG: bifunctional heptose 7-phosphate kinase/heptose 1-phosphate adenyltransferase [Candidatus Sumerlaeaceae bacterium]